MATAADAFFGQCDAFALVVNGSKSACSSAPVEKKGSENENKLSQFISKLRARQVVLKNFAESSGARLKQEQIDERKQQQEKLPTNQYAYLGSKAVIDELRQCANPLRAAFTVNSEASKDVSLVKISVVDLVSVDVSVNRISGAILSASVNSSNLPRDVVSAVSVKLSDLLQKSKLEEFGQYLRDWVGVYCDNIGDSAVKLRPKVIAAVGALLHDIDALNNSFTSGLDADLRNMVKSVVHGSPCGLFQKPPIAPKPSIKFFVNPYDVMKAKKCMESDVSELPNEVGITANLEFQQFNSPKILPESALNVSNPQQQLSKGSSSVRKVQNAPMVINTQPLRVSPSLNNNNSSPMPVAFALTFEKPFPIFSCYLRELQDFTKSVLVDDREPMNWLYALSAYQSIVPDYEHNYTHKLPNCDLRARIVPSKCSEEVSKASCFSVQSVLFTHVNPLPHILHILRKQAVINALVGDVMKKQDLISGGKAVEVWIPSVDQVQIVFSHPLKPTCRVTISVQMLVPDFANPSCKVATSDGIFVCDDSYATTILRNGDVLVLVDDREPMNWLYALSAYQSIVPDYEHNYTHKLPNCDLRARIVPSKCSEEVSKASCFSVQSVLFTHVNPLPHILHILRKQAVINALVGDVMKKQDLISGGKAVEVWIPSVDQVQIVFSHPLKPTCRVTISVQMLVPDFANPSCKVATSDGIFVCDDSYATTILRKCGSLAHLTRCVLRKCNNSSLNIDVCTPPTDVKTAPPLTPTIDLKTIIAIDKSGVESIALDNDVPNPAQNLPSNLGKISSNSNSKSSAQPMKLSEILNDSASNSSVLGGDQPEEILPQSLTLVTDSPSVKNPPATQNRKRSHVKSTQEDSGVDVPKAGKGKQGKAKKSVSVAGPAPSLDVNQASIQMQQFQMLSMIANNPLFMSSAMLPPPSVTPELQSNSSAPGTSTQVQPNPALPSGTQDSKLREILNSPKTTPATPTSSVFPGLPFNAGAAAAAVAAATMDPLAAQRKSVTPPAMSPLHPDFLLSQQAALAMQFHSLYGAGNLKNPTGMFSSATPNLVDVLDPTAHSAFNYPPTIPPFLQQSLSMPAGGFNMDAKSSVSASPVTLTPSSTPDVHNSNSNSSHLDLDLNKANATAAAAEERDRERAMKHLAELIKQLENKNNLSHAEIENIETQMNQISEKLKAGPTMPGQSNVTGSHKRKGSTDLTDSSSVSSNQSLNDSKNSNDSTFSAPTKKSKNSGPPKRRGRPPKSDLRLDGQFLYPQVSAKGHDLSVSPSSSGTIMAQTLGKIPKSASTSGSTKSKNEFDAFELSDDSSDSNMLPGAVFMPNTVAKVKPKAVKKKSVKKQQQNSNAGTNNSDTTTTYRSLNKSDTVIVIKKMQVASSANSNVSKDESNSSVKSSSNIASSVSVSNLTTTTSSPGDPQSMLKDEKALSQDHISVTSAIEAVPSMMGGLSSNGMHLPPPPVKPSIGSNQSSSKDLPPFHLSAKNVAAATEAARHAVSPMKNLLASFTAENSVPVASISKSSSLSSLASAPESETSVAKSDQNASESQAINLSQSSLLKDKEQNVGKTDATSIASSNLQPGLIVSKTSSTLGSSSMQGTNSPVKKRPGLESVVNKLSQSPGASNSSGSSSQGSSPISSQKSSSSGSIKIGATKFLSPSNKSDSLKLMNKQKVIVEKSKSISDKFSGNATKVIVSKPTSPISTTLPAFLKSSNKLGNFVIPKKKSSSGASSSTSGVNSNSSSLTKSGDSTSALGKNTGEPKSDSQKESKGKQSSDKTFDFPGTDDQPLSVPNLKPISSKPSSSHNSSSAGFSNSGSSINSSTVSSLLATKVSSTFSSSGLSGGLTLKPVITRSPIDLSLASSSNQDPKPLNLSTDTSSVVAKTSSATDKSSGEHNQD